MTDLCRVLFVEDDQEDYLLTKLLLSRTPHLKFDLVWTDSPEKGLEQLEKQGFDICLVDFNLGATDGLDFLRKATEFYPQLPFVLLTGLNNHEVDNEAMKNGASDYVVKGTFDAESLERTIRHAIERKRQEIELLKTRDELANALNQIKLDQKKLVEMENLKSVQQLAGAVAHDFSQPLQAIVNYADLIKRENPDSDYIKKLLSNIEKINNLTDNLRNITQLSKKSYLDNEILDIKSVQPSKVTPITTKNKILIVDDEPHILETLIEMFHLKGYNCDGVENGSQALEKIKNEKYHFIVSDINMPIMNGTEFFEHFRKYDRETPFIFITGYEVSDNIKKVVKHADAIINKPVNFEHFFAMIQKILQSRN